MARRLLLILGFLVISVGLTGLAFAGQSDSLILKVTVDILAPSAPTGLTATAGDSAVDLSWNANPEADLAGYNLYRSTTSGSGYIKANSVLITDTNYHDSSLTNGTTYYYVITAVDNFNNESDYSDEVSAAPGGGPSETEPNDNFTSANSINPDSWLNGTINPSGDQDYFKVTIAKKGLLNISLTDVPENINAWLYVFDSDHSFIGSGYSGGNGNDINLQQEVPYAGDYYILVFDNDNNSSSSPYRLQVSFFYFGIYSVNAYPDYFSPNADGNQDVTAIYASITTPAEWTINIKDSLDAVKRTFTGTGATIEQAWDGKNSQGNILPEGTYTYTIDATDPDTKSTAPQVSGQITIDITPPTASITEPASGQTLSGRVDIKGTAEDLNFYYGYLYYGQGTSPTQWNYLSYIESKVGPAPGLLAECDTSTASNGDYCIRLEVYDAAGNMKRVDLPVTLYNVNIYSVYAYPDYFSPNADGNQDVTAIYASITTPADWTINIKDSLDAVKRTFTGTGATIEQAWDGKDSLNAVVPDGIYTYTIDATEPGTGSTVPQVSGQITVDSTLPTASITEPVSGANLSGIVAIKGTAEDLNFYYGYLYYGEGASPTQWNFINYVLGNVGPEPGLLAEWDTGTTPNGNYCLRLEVYDQAGNLKRVDVLVELYNVNIYSVYAYPDYFSPNADGQQDSATIYASITTPADWSINIKDSSDQVKRTFTGTGATIEQAWDGKDSLNAVVPDGIYTYAIDAVDPTPGGSTAPQVSGQITVDNTPPTASITEPVSGTKLSGSVAIEGTVDDLSFTYGYLYYGEGTSPAYWNYIGYVWGNVGPEPGLLAEWDTSTMPNGDYCLRLEVYDQAGNLKRVDLPVTLYNVNIYDTYSSPNPFSPNGDGKKDAVLISASISGLLNWSINIKDSGDSPVRAFAGSGNNINQIWDGRNSEARIVSDGTYTYYINATDGTSQAPEVSGTVVVDNTPPIASLTQPQANEIIGGVYEIRGVADDLHFASYTGAGGHSYLAYGAGASPAYWTYLATIYNPIPQEDTIYEWDTTQLASGQYTLRLVVVDHAENSNIVTVPINLCKVGEYYDTVDPFSPNADGIKDATAVIATLSQILNWTIDIKDSSNHTLRTFTGSGKMINQAWDGKDGAGVVAADGTYTYYITAKDPQTNGVVFTGSSTAAVDNTPPDVNITYPVSGGQISDTVEVRGLIDDVHFDGENSFLAYGQGESPSSWQIISYIYNSVPSETILVYWYTANLVNDAYTLRLVGADTAGNVAERLVPVNVHNVKILQFSILPNPFSPDGDTKMDTTTFSATFTMSLDWLITVKDHQGFTVKTFSDQGNSFSQVWDGTDTTGTQVVADGIYNYTITVTEPVSGKSDQVSGQVTVDKEAPLAEITSPTNGKIVFGVIPILGTASDANLTSYTVEYGPGNDPEDWTTIASYYAPVINGLLTNWDTHNLSNGVYTIRLTVEDVVGHIATTSVTVALDNIEITNVSLNPATFNPANNETVTIAYALDRNATVTLQIYDLDNTLVRTLIDSVPRQQGANSETWDGKNDSGNIVSEGGYTITIKADAGRGWYQSSGGYVQNWDVVSGFTVTKNFNPYNNELCVIRFNLSENSLFSLGIGQHENYNTYQWVINHKLLSLGAHTFYWDGRDSQGQILDYYTQDFPLVVAYDSLSLPQNTIVVTSQKPDELGVSTDPFAIVVSYGEIADITYTLPAEGTVSLSIYAPPDTLIKKLVDHQTQAAGTYSFTWDGTDSSGKPVSEAADYIVQVEFVAGDKTIVRSGNISVDFIKRQKNSPF